ncbi:peptide/nickel transport system permease protein [Kitasatospora sp. MMS16-BH015]|uniref:ABC transporter permease n=1 Tax=Kitasatospora sp. MMS16-BH015 TaxID=2018025 RepID=UPI000CA0F856|nr:ABC transporter permease [Kitasatospora sp. MMS16-BH015]AUG75386.1 peptide/nickel transport system permease protein [Kitasatospora sp. MMS16-BH015]
MPKDLTGPQLPVGAPEQQGAGRSRPERHQTWRRLRADRAATVALVAVTLLVLTAVAAPLISAAEGQDPTTYHNDLVDSATGGVPIGSFGGAGAQHWLGVEPGTGRDVLARLVYGAQISLAVSIGATAVQLTLGVLIGLAAGLGNRAADTVLSRTMDLAIAFPSLVFAVALMAVVPSGFPRPLLLMLVIGVLGWGTTARIVRGQVLTLRGLDYVSAARLAGSTRWRVARREILPALAGPVITYGVLQLPVNVSLEAGLSFLGVGVRPPTSSWGQMLSSATDWFQADPAYVLLPAGLLFVTILSFTVLGDGVRTALDPRARSRLRAGIDPRRGKAGPREAAS